MPSDRDRYTAGRLNTDLRRIVRNLIDHAPRALDEPAVADPDLAALDALASIAVAVDSMIDRHIVSARRREQLRRDWTITPGRPVPWDRIGDALEPLAGLIREGRRLIDDGDLAGR